MFSRSMRALTAANTNRTRDVYVTLQYDINFTYEFRTKLYHDIIVVGVKCLKTVPVLTNYTRARDNVHIVKSDSVVNTNVLTIQPFRQQLLIYPTYI